VEKKLSPKARGELTEAIVLAKLIEYGDSVSLPFGDNKRYDMVIDDGRQLHRIQVKTARDGRGARSIEFNTVSTHPISGRRTKYHGQIEAFIAYHPGLREFYWVPVEECSSTKCTLRVFPSKNNQKRGVRITGSYRLQPAPTTSLAETGS
jgi:phage-related protein